MDAGSTWDDARAPERSPDMEVLDRLELGLEDGARALRRLDEGTYATCEVCAQPIGDDRLATSPVTRRCAQHDPAAIAVPPVEG